MLYRLIPVSCNFSGYCCTTLMAANKVLELMPDDEEFEIRKQCGVIWKTYKSGLRGGLKKDLRSWFRVSYLSPNECYYGEKNMQLPDEEPREAAQTILDEGEESCIQHIILNIERIEAPEKKNVFYKVAEEIYKGTYERLEAVKAHLETVKKEIEEGKRAEDGLIDDVIEEIGEYMSIVKIEEGKGSKRIPFNKYLQIQSIIKNRYEVRFGTEEWSKSVYTNSKKDAVYEFKRMQKKAERYNLDIFVKLLVDGYEENENAVLCD